jgi:hypothetical protein
LGLELEHEGAEGGGGVPIGPLGGVTPGVVVPEGGEYGGGLGVLGPGGGGGEGGPPQISPGPHAVGYMQ